MDDKEKRTFRTLDEIQEEYNATDHNFKDELKDVAQNFKSQIFSPWGLLILSALVMSILSAVVR